MASGWAENGACGIVGWLPFGDQALLCLEKVGARYDYCKWKDTVEKLVFYKSMLHL